MAIRLYMTMSLDGYVVGPRDSVDAPMGADGFRLFNWLDRRNDPGPSGTVYAEEMATRAVIAGRRTYEHAGRWQGDHHDGVPIFILTHDVPQDPPPGSVHYVTDARDAAARAAPQPGTRMSWCTGPGRHRRCCGPGSSTSWNCTSCRSCWGRGVTCSTTCPQNTLSST
jgi:dihydrofolate reductase